MISVLEPEVVWNDAKPLIEKALKKYPDYGWTIEDVRKAVDTKDLQLWIDAETPKIVVLTKIVEQPSALQCWIWLAGGELPDNWEEHLSDIEKWAKWLGCDYILEQGREGWQRKLGWERRYVVTQKRLKDA